MRPNGQRINKSTSAERKIYIFLLFTILLGVIILLGRIFYPEATGILLDIIWLFFLTIVVIFLGLGTLVIFGLKQEVHQLLDLLLEGTLSIIDFVEFCKVLWRQFIQKIKDFIFFITPHLMFLINLVMYTVLIVTYKTIGKNYDVTAFTAIATFVLVAFVSILNMPKGSNLEDLTWAGKLKKRAGRAFTDGFEIVLFLFFLTIDSTNLFFLPPSLNIPLRAEFAGYDLMKRGLSTNDIKFTLTIIIIAISVEIVRRALRISLMASKYYKEMTTTATIQESKAETIKKSVRKSFGETRDDIVKFIAFNTILLFVFLIFPRLKLLSLAIASITNITLDLAFPQRLRSITREENDLISRTITKTFKL